MRLARLPVVVLCAAFLLTGCATTKPAAPPETPPAAVVVPPLEVSFFDTPVHLKCAPLQASLAELSDAAISAFVAELDAKGGAECLESLRIAHEALDLNDWGYFLLVRDVSVGLFAGRVNEATLLAWYLMSRSNYKAMLRYNREHPFLLLASDQQMVRMRQAREDGQRYYIVIPAELPSTFSLGAVYPAGEDAGSRMIDFRLHDAPRISTTLVPVERTFKYRGRTHRLMVRYNEGLIRFLDTYPRGDLGMYLTAPLSSELDEDLAAGLGPLLEDKSEVEALNILLAFVQYGFRYREDALTFGYERFLLPDEVFFYPYSDCEDRSILFSYLVRRFLDLDVIGLRYPNHIATAVRTTVRVDGQSVMHGGHRYVVADPTFFGSPIGAVVPHVARLKPEVIPPAPGITGSAALQVN